MKLSSSTAMRRLLKEGIKLARDTRAPGDGMMRSLIYRTLRNGWHYQVEYINDSRRYERPYVVVYAFAPPRNMAARPADLFLEQEVNPS